MLFVFFLSLRFNQGRLGSWKCPQRVDFLLTSIFFGIFWSNCHEWMRGPIWNWLERLFPDLIGSFHSYIFNSALGLDVSDFFTKLKDWVISVSFPSFPDVYCTPLIMSVFSLSVLEAFEICKFEKKVTEPVTLDRPDQTRDARTFIERASMYCADYPYLIKNLEAGRKERLFCCIFCLKNEVLWNRISR